MLGVIGRIPGATGTVDDLRRWLEEHSYEDNRVRVFLIHKTEEEIYLLVTPFGEDLKSRTETHFAMPIRISRAALLSHERASRKDAAIFHLDYVGDPLIHNVPFKNHRYLYLESRHREMVIPFKTKGEFPSKIIEYLYAKLEKILEIQMEFCADFFSALDKMVRERSLEHYNELARQTIFSDTYLDLCRETAGLLVRDFEGFQNPSEKMKPWDCLPGHLLTHRAYCPHLLRRMARASLSISYLSNKEKESEFIFQIDPGVREEAKTEFLAFISDRDEPTKNGFRLHNLAWSHVASLIYLGILWGSALFFTLFLPLFFLSPTLMKAAVIETAFVVGNLIISGGRYSTGVVGTVRSILEGA
ncbi:MAG: hypothetical protein HYU64_20640 [Armatimonadetes bacterium]|nr:hypothetical protein [Armatimonadota bacterium]